MSYLDRLLDPLTEALNPESASALLNLRANEELESRIEELRQKANEGTLTAAEDAEYILSKRSTWFRSCRRRPAVCLRDRPRNRIRRFAIWFAIGRTMPANTAVFLNRRHR